MKNDKSIIRLPIGQDDFSKLIDSELTFVDKTLLVQAILSDPAEAILITRPRRFGKTLNLSMLHYFFAATVRGRSTQGLFNAYHIAQHPEAMQHQGQYPVITLTFKDLKMPDYPSLCLRFSEIMSNLYAVHETTLANTLHPRQKKQYDSVLERTATPLDLQTALQSLMHYLYEHYHKPVILLVDEYDTAIQSGYVNDYYDQAINLIRGFLSAALKNNPNLYKAVLTGILRVSKESLFSGLNNLKVYSVLNPEYGQYFGFTEPEVQDLFTQTRLASHLPEVKKWYNGYQIGTHVIYNPWSIVNCIQSKGVIEPYWVNTSDNALIKKLLIQASIDIKEKIHMLLQGTPIEVLINEHFVFSELTLNESALWSLLLMTGYLKAIDYTLTAQGLKQCHVAIPNLEVWGLYICFINEWLADHRGIDWYNGFLARLLSGDLSTFEKDLEYMMESIASIHDMAREPEAFYQGFLLGLTACLHRGAYSILSNRESGLGRYDIAIIPHDIQKTAILIELKSISAPSSTTTLDDALIAGAHIALAQIKTRHYLTDLQQRGITHTLCIGIACSGKKVKMLQDPIS